MSEVAFVPRIVDALEILPIRPVLYTRIITISSGATPVLAGVKYSTSTALNPFGVSLDLTDTDSGGLPMVGFLSRMIEISLVYTLNIGTFKNQASLTYPRGR